MVPFHVYNRLLQLANFIVDVLYKLAANQGNVEFAIIVSRFSIP